MSKNQIQRGENLTFPAPAAVNSGDPVQVGAIRGIALVDAEAGQPVDVATSGVFLLSKVAADALALGDAVFLSASGLATKTGTGAAFGVAVEAAAAGTGTAKVRIAAF